MSKKNIDERQVKNEIKTMTTAPNYYRDGKLGKCDVCFIPKTTYPIYLNQNPDKTSFVCFECYHPILCETIRTTSLLKLATNPSMFDKKE